jgi:hypothetical protein
MVLVAGDTGVVEDEFGAAVGEGEKERLAGNGRCHGPVGPVEMVDRARIGFHAVVVVSAKRVIDRLQDEDDRDLESVDGFQSGLGLLKQRAALIELPAVKEVQGADSGAYDLGALRAAKLAGPSPAILTALGDEVEPTVMLLGQRLGRQLGVLPGGHRRRFAHGNSREAGRYRESA